MDGRKAVADTMGETLESTGNMGHLEGEDSNMITMRENGSVTKKIALEKECSLEALNSDSLEHISCYLDTKTSLALYRTSKTVHKKLVPCTQFWKSLCKNENFQDCEALKSVDKEKEIAPRLAWTGGKLIDFEVPQEASLWRKIFLRGLEMRRNICSGKYELCRLFMTDEESLPVKPMKPGTTFQELMSSHRKLMPFDNPNRHVRTGTDFNNDFFIATHENFEEVDLDLDLDLDNPVQDNPVLSHDIFVWSWNDCQTPKFHYSFDMLPLYPTSLRGSHQPDPLKFLHKNYLVLMPEIRFTYGAAPTRSMLRVHDLSDNMALVGSYDFPLDGHRRHFPADAEIIIIDYPILCEVGGKAVALCRTPNFMIFVFSIPSCELLHQVCLPENIERPLELDELDSEIFQIGSTVMFKFYDLEFFDDFLFEEALEETEEKKYVRLVVVDLKPFLESGQPIKPRLDNRFEDNEDYIERISLIKEDRIVCLMMSGKIQVRDIVATSDVSSSFVERLSFPCPEPLRPHVARDGPDGPALFTSHTGELILAMRQFVSGKKIHAFSSQGSLRYVIDLEAAEYGLEGHSGYVGYPTIDINTNFVCVADLEKVVIWNISTGRRVSTIQIPKHYASWEDPQEIPGIPMWRGYRYLDFQEDRIIITHCDKNFPAIADVYRFV